MKQHTLTADAGSTKTMWAIDGILCQTQGINPIHQTDETISAILCDELCPQLRGVNIEVIRYYGSGVRPEQEARMARLLARAFPSAKSVEAKSDMLGAARALCGESEGIACILGTGSNSCLYDGNGIVRQTPSLGYILGDEGSGARLGISFLHELYKGRLYAGAKEEFEEKMGMTLQDIISRVYTQPMANRFLASLSPYIHDHLYDEEVRLLVVDNFQRFISCNVSPYQRPDLPLSAVGSIAFYYQEELARAARNEGYALGRVLKAPLVTS